MLYAVKDENGKLWSHTVAPTQGRSWKTAMFNIWTSTGKIDGDDIKGSTNNFIKEYEAKGCSVVPVAVALTEITAAWNGRSGRKSKRSVT